MERQHAHRVGLAAPVHSAVPVYRNVGVQVSECVSVEEIPELTAAYALLRAATATFDAAVLTHFANVEAVSDVPVAVASAATEVETLANGWLKKTKIRKSGRGDIQYVLPASVAGESDVLVGSVQKMDAYIATSSLAP
jgi:hypothetical protein